MWQLKGAIETFHEDDVFFKCLLQIRVELESQQKCCWVSVFVIVWEYVEGEEIFTEKEEEEQCLACTNNSQGMRKTKKRK